MDLTKSFRHQNYELLCGARAVDNGRFAPTLCVTKHVWPSRPRQIAMARGDFESEQSAIDAAYRQGLDWVSNYG
ncbi:MAG: hypothetical protein ABJA61_05345 [Caldimonas sp.]